MFLNPRSGNENQILQVYYATCLTRWFFLKKCIYAYLQQMHSLFISLCNMCNNNYYFLLSGHFINMDG